MSRKFPQALFSVLIVIFFSTSSHIAFASTTGGACPSAASYMDPAGVGTAGTLSSFGISSCFYIDFVGGSDSNSGLSEAAPLKRAPGMQGCSGSCAAISPSGGFGFILKGGVTWDSTTQPWNWNWSGNSGAPIYIGYDPS